MAEKYSTEDGEELIIATHLTSMKLSSKDYKNGSKPIVDCVYKKLNQLTTLFGCSIVTPIRYKEKHYKIVHYINRKIWKYYEKLLFSGTLLLKLIEK